MLPGNKKKAEQEKALRDIRNFCAAYTLEEAYDILGKLYLMYDNAHAHEEFLSSDEISDFLESLEELLPAVIRLEELRKRERDQMQEN